MGVYLRAKFEVSSIILTGFRQGVILPPTPPQNEPLKSPPRLRLTLKNSHLCKPLNLSKPNCLSNFTDKVDHYVFVSIISWRLSSQDCLKNTVSYCMNRSSRPELFYKKVFFKILQILQGNTCAWFVPIIMFIIFCETNRGYY